jgi:histone-lysine N-methyltransferase SETMAR
MSSFYATETRGVIKFCCELGYSPTKTYEMIQETSAGKSVSRTQVFEWHRRFREGRVSLEDDGGRGRKSSIDSTFVSSVKDVVDRDRRVTIRDICTVTGFSFGTVQRILTEHLNMKKVSARWVPRLLTDTNKENRVMASRKFIKRYRRDGVTFLDHIVTADETWLYLFDPETKEQSRQWKTPGSPTPKKARVTKTCGKQMYIFFADRHGMILMHAVPIGQNVNAAYYGKVPEFYYKMIYQILILFILT